MTTEIEVPKVVMSNKLFTCPTCQALVSCHVDIFAGSYEVIPDELELHLQWHDRNDK